MVTPNTLTEEQIERLNAALRKRAGVVPASEPRPAPVSVDEYTRRLREDMERDQALAVQARKENIAKNVELWHQTIEPRWRDASIDDGNMDPQVRSKIQERVERWETGRGLHQISMLFTGHLGRGKTWSAYAYAYELVRRGILAPAQIFISTETTLAAIATSGFEKEKRMKEILHPRYKFYFIDDIGRAAYGNASTNAAARGEMWFELLNHIYTRQLAFVGTTNLAARPPEKSKNAGVEDAPKRPYLNGWIGAASFERLGHMVGSTGYHVFGEDSANMRREMGEQWEKRYQSNRQA